MIADAPLSPPALDPLSYPPLCSLLCYAHLDFVAHPLFDLCSYPYPAVLLFVDLFSPLVQ